MINMVTHYTITVLDKHGYTPQEIYHVKRQPSLLREELLRIMQQHVQIYKDQYFSSTQTDDGNMNFLSM